MIAEILKDDFFSFEEMARILSVKPSTLKLRIYSGTAHPPYVKEGKEYLFPKENFRRWMKDRPAVEAVRA